MITKSDLCAVMPQATQEHIGRFCLPLNDAMDEFHINTPTRQAAFLAQIGHESGQLRYSEEIASGEAYEGRANLGNIEVGDGKRYKGRGLIQVTGRANYAACGAALGLELIDDPFLLKEPINACRSAGWFWESRGLNILADAGKFDQITRRINGGLTGQTERVALWERAKKHLT